MHQRLSLQLNLRLNLLWSPLRFPSMHNGLSLNLTESSDLCTVHGDQSISLALGGCHNGLSLGGGLDHGLGLCLKFGSFEYANEEQEGGGERRRGIEDDTPTDGAGVSHDGNWMLCPSDY